MGLVVVLLQENKEGRLFPIQWASKNLTPMEERYGITGKEMLAVMWGAYKFKYELSGRKFYLITDHKALENLRSKAEFGNNRVNRRICMIQEYDLTIKYRKGRELFVPDALSRLYEEDKIKFNGKEKPKSEKGVQIKEVNGRSM